MENIIPKKIRLPLLLLLVGFVFWFGLKPGWNQVESDFPNYYVSAKMLLEGNLQDAYSIEKFDAKIREYSPTARGLFVMYPPATALLMEPLCLLDILSAKRIWLIISLLLMVHSIFITSRLMHFTLFQSALIFLLAGFNLANDFMLGQIYTCMLWLLLIGWDSFINKKYIQSSLAWAVLAALKFLPLFFLPFLLYKKEYKTLMYFTIFFCLLQSIVLLQGGAAVFVAFAESFNSNYLSAQVANLVPTSVQYQSVKSLLNATMPLNGQYGIWHLAINYCWQFIWILWAVFTMIKFRNTLNFLMLAISNCILVLLLLEVGSATYHLLFCFFPLLYVFQYASPNYCRAMLFLWIMMGFFPTIQSKLLGSITLLSYSRLLLLVLFSFLFFWSLKPNNNNGLQIAA